MSARYSPFQCPECLALPMSTTEWKRVPKDYKLTCKGERFVMQLDPTTQATVLVRVILTDQHRCASAIR
jgi:hypothetical protein